MISGECSLIEGECSFNIGQEELTTFIGSLSFELGLCTLYQIHKKSLGTN